MNRGILKSARLGLIMVAALVAMTVPFQREIDDIRGKYRSITESIYVSSSTLKRVSLGYDLILADIYWLRALQYFGGTKHSQKDPDLLTHYFNIITDLDPKFLNAYRYGGTFLADGRPLGLGAVEQGMNLFEKGKANLPDSYFLPLEQAFIYFTSLKDYEKAAQYFDEAADKPKLTAFRRGSLKGMAALAHSKGGDRDLAKQVWTYIYENSTSEGRKNFAETNLKEIFLMEAEELLTKAVGTYYERLGKMPDGLEDLVRTKILKHVPTDPFGDGYIILQGQKQIKSIKLAKNKFIHATSFLSSRAKIFKRTNDRYPNDIAELRDFLENTQNVEFREHPFGEEYDYDPETGIVTAGKYQKWIDEPKDSNP